MQIISIKQHKNIINH